MSVLDRLKDAVGAKGFSTDPSEIAPHLEEWRGKYHGHSPLLLKPASAADVSAALRICHETGTPIVPQGGNTGLVGGQIPGQGPYREILLSLKRLDKVREIDVSSNTMTLEAGVTLADPARIDIRGMLSCGKDVAIDVNCVFEGDVVLGNDIVIGPNCVLKNVRIKAGTRIEAFCHLEDAEVGAHCRIGPYARLRPGAQLDEHVHIGNFVEVKKSTIGAGSKANHLAYVGDSEVGSNVNIGAGTITCNYDGFAKHRTVIGADVFIGSDSILVAPVSVGDGAMVTAGSVITENVPADAMAFGRARQDIKAGRAAAFRASRKKTK